MSKNNYISNKDKRGRYNSMLKISCILLSALIITCSHSKEKQAKMELGDSKATEQAAYQIIIWKGGGFSGQVSGFTLSSNGEVTRWQRFPGQSDTILWKGAASLAEIQKIRSQLEQSMALEMKADVTGNMTAGVSYTTKETALRWTWRYTGSDDSIPEAIRSWFKEAMAFCRALENNK